MNCLPYLDREITLIQPRILVALGRIAFDNILRILSIQEDISFIHNAVHSLPGGRWLVSSYHPSRQNTQTGRLTKPMFDQVWKTVRALLER
jgi:uracil-DNA glycosylase family 4